MYTSFDNDSTEGRSPDLAKREEAWNLEHPLIVYLHITKFKNKIIDLGEIMSYMSPDYLVLSEVKLDDSCPLAQFNIPDHQIRAIDQNGGGLIEFVKKVITFKR